MKKGVGSSKLLGRSSEGLVALEEFAVSRFDSDMLCCEKGEKKGIEKRGSGPRENGGSCYNADVRFESRYICTCYFDVHNQYNRSFFIDHLPLRLLCIVALVIFSHSLVIDLVIHVSL